MTTTTSEPTVLIIGAGTFGTSTAYHLAHSYNDASRITVIDRWDRTDSLANKQAAAIDTNRIIRTDYESPMYCDLANEAIHPWFWSIAVQGHFHKTGWVVLEGKDGDGGFGENVRRTFKERGGDYTRDITAEKLDEYDVLQGFCGGDEWSRGYFNPEAGWCDAESATTSFMKVAIEQGVRRVQGEVTRLLFDEKNNRIEGVQTKSGKVYTADKILLATGAWTSFLLSPIEDTLQLPYNSRIERQITAVGRLSAYYTLSQKETQSIIDSKMPIVVLAGQVDIIPPSQPNRTLKINDLKTEVVNTVTTSSGHKVTIPSIRHHQYSVPSQLTYSSEKVLKSALPHFTKAHKPSRWRICYDAVTPTEDWLLTRHPHSKLANLYIATGGSFHSYKFLPVAGKYVAIVLRGESCGAEKDAAWGWKREDVVESARGERGKEFGERKERERIEMGALEGGERCAKL